MISKPDATCPLSPSRIHRVYYSARNGAKRGAATCRDCSQEVYFIDGSWILPPPGEILLSMMLEFQARVIEGNPDGIRNPRGIFGFPVVESELATEIDRMIGPISVGRVSLLPPMPSIVS